MSSSSPFPPTHTNESKTRTTTASLSSSTTATATATATATSNKTRTKSTPRNNLKDATASAQRRAMTSRRHELTTQIRKARRSHAVQLKRRVGVIPSGSGAAMGMDVHVHDNDSGSGGAASFSPLLSSSAAAASAFPSSSASSSSSSASLQRVMAHQAKLADIVEAYLHHGTAAIYSNSYSSGQTLAALNALQTALARAPPETVSSSLHPLLLPIHTATTVTATAKMTTCRGEMLVHLLSKTLLDERTGITTAARLDAARILTNLAATEDGRQLSEEKKDVNNDDEEECGYYGKQDWIPSWCDLFLSNADDTGGTGGNALLSLLSTIQTFTNAFFHANTNINVNINTVGEEWYQHMELCQQCCWAVGNFAGDSQKARDAARNAGAVLPLVQCLRLALRFSHDNTNVSVNVNVNVNGNAHTNACRWNAIVIGLGRNAAWAISNLARGAYTSAKPFLAMLNHSNHSGASDGVGDVDMNTASLGSNATAVSGGGEGMLSPREIGELLLVAETQTPILPSTTTTTTTNPAAHHPTSPSWYDVTVETCWIVAFLTAREDEAVDFLCCWHDSPICQALAFRLTHAAAQFIATSTTSSTVHLEDNAFHMALRTSIPCIRAVGNIATACNGEYVSKLISTTLPSHLLNNNHTNATTEHFIPNALAHLIQASITTNNNQTQRIKTQLRGDLSAVATEAAWAAGTLLCDAGRPDPHPSTTIACPILVPALCAAVTSPLSKLDLKREAVSALWNAVSSPPPPPSSSSSSQNHNHSSISMPTIQKDDTLLIRDQILMELCNTNNMIHSLVQLLSTSDADAVHSSLQLVNAMLRRFGDLDHRIRRLFDEAECLDALEAICDRVSASSVYGQDGMWRGNDGGTTGSGLEQCAEMAADLIDDVFGEEILARDEDENDDVMLVQTDTGEQRFAFGVQVATGYPSNTGGLMFGGLSSNGGSPGVMANAGLSVNGRGRGRGRGSTVPAWMQQQQSMN